MKQPMKPSRIVQFVCSSVALATIIVWLVLSASGRDGTTLNTVLIAIAGVSIMVSALAQIPRRDK
jgi:hypothetical protein